MGRQGSPLSGLQPSAPSPSPGHTGDLDGRQVDSLAPGLTWAVTHAQTPGSQDALAPAPAQRPAPAHLPAPSASTPMSVGYCFPVSAQLSTAYSAHGVRFPREAAFPGSSSPQAKPGSCLTP